jgi:2'-5' RNA ligase
MGRPPEQSSVDGFDDPLQPTDRLFFAVLPDTDTGARIARFAQHLRRQHGLKGRALAAGRFHVTLHHIGDFVGPREDIIDAAREAAASVAASPFIAGFDRVASFSGKPHKPRKAPLVLLGGDGLLALVALQQALGAALAKAGLGRVVAAHYTPHLTLLYDDRHVAAQAIEPISWTVREFVLVLSLIGQSQYIALARLPLRG